MQPNNPYYSIEINATVPTSNDDFLKFTPFSAVTASPEFDFAFKVDGRAVLEFHNNRDMVVRDEGPQAFMDLINTANAAKRLQAMIAVLLPVAQIYADGTLSIDAINFEWTRGFRITVEAIKRSDYRGEYE